MPVVERYSAGTVYDVVHTTCRMHHQLGLGLGGPDSVAFEIAYGTPHEWDQCSDAQGLLARLQTLIPETIERLRAQGDIT